MMPDDINQKIIELAADGWSRPDIAARLNVTLYRVGGVLGRHNSKKGNNWTPERVEMLKKMWLKGYSSTQIARYFGDCTRNAVIGVIHRRGLSRREGNSSKNRHHIKPTVAKPKAKPVFVRASPPPEPLPDDGSTPVTVMTLTNRICKYPVGTVTGEHQRFCGRPAPGEGPYCEGHAAVAYRPAEERRQPSRVKRVRGG